MGQDKLPAWKKLSHLAASSKTVFQNIKDRLQKEHTKIKLYTLDGLALDISKNIINEEILFNLQLLTKECLLPEKIKSLFSANKINKTENRAAAHWLLRGVLGNDKKILNWSDKVTDELTKMENIVDKILSGQWRGFNGKAVTDVVNLGVGGSELGPLMVCTALTDFEVKVINPVNIHFASSIDGSQLSILLKKLNPETTLFILASKSFTTIDTFSNAETAKKWMSLYCQDESIIIQQHFIGISAKQNLMDEWGLGRDNQLLFWDWVGGRFSLWSTIGLPIALKIGMKGFRELLKGAHSMDEHFMQADFSDNLPVILAMVGIWNVNFLHIQQHAILPYDGRFIFFPQFLQQLEMESNGKSVANTGEKVQYSTCPVIWGGLVRIHNMHFISYFIKARKKFLVILF